MSSPSGRWARVFVRIDSRRQQYQSIEQITNYCQIFGKTGVKLTIQFLSSLQVTDQSVRAVEDAFKSTVGVSSIRAPQQIFVLVEVLSQKSHLESTAASALMNHPIGAAKSYLVKMTPVEGSFESYEVEMDPQMLVRNSFRYNSPLFVGVPIAPHSPFCVVCLHSALWPRPLSTKSSWPDRFQIFCCFALQHHWRSCCGISWWIFLRRNRNQSKTLFSLSI